MNTKKSNVATPVELQETTKIGTVTIEPNGDGRLKITGNALDFKDMGAALSTFKGSGFSYESTNRAAKIISSVNTVLKALNKSSNALIREYGTEMPDKSLKVLVPGDAEFKPEEHADKYEAHKAAYEKLEESENSFVFTPIKYGNLFCKNAMAKDEMPIAPAALSWLLEFKFIVD